MARRSTGWKAEARAMTEAVPYARSQRIRRNLRQRALEAPVEQRRRWSSMVAFVAGAVLVLLIVRPVLDATDPPPRDEVADAKISADGAAPDEAAATEPAASTEARDLALVVEGPPHDKDVGELHDDAGLKLQRPCVIRGSGVVLRHDGSEDLWLRGDAERVELLRGRLEVEVDPTIDRERAFTVVTPTIRIEVTGTRFAISHDEQDGGVLELWEGSVRVIEQSGQLRRVSAGQRLRWRADGSKPSVSSLEASSPKASSGARTSSKPARTPRRRSGVEPPAASDRADRLVRELERLRERGRLSEAVRLLEDGLPTLHRRDRDVLSYELGQLLERTRGAKAACAHWDAYQRSFPNSRYADLVEIERARLECDQ